MSINWVMLSDTEGFVLLPQEKRLWSSPPRTSLSLNSLSKYPGHEPFSLSNSAGTVHITNRRLVYLPTPRTATFQSFAAPLTNLHDSHISAPWFGANAWIALCQPVNGGGLPPRLPAVELKFTFNEGGAFDFHTTFERVKERLGQAMETARERRGTDGASSAAMDVGNVDLDELPAYDGPGVDMVQPVTVANEETGSVTNSHQTVQAETQQPSPPVEPPPGYEEVQRGSVAQALESSLRFRR